MTLEGMIRNAEGQTAVRKAEGADYAAAKAQLEQLVGEGSKLLRIRSA